MKERIFTCLEGEKTVAFNGRLVEISGVVQLRVLSEYTLEIRINFNDSHLILRFGQSYWMVKYEAIYNNRMIDLDTFNFSTDNTIYVTLIPSYNKIIAIFKLDWGEKVKIYNVNISPGDIAVTLYRSFTDEEYCSDLTVEYEPIQPSSYEPYQHPLIQIIQTAVLMMAFTTVIGTLLKVKTSNSG